MNHSAQTHLVLGAGQVGLLLAKELVRCGHRVRLVRRGPAKQPIKGVTWMSGDITDPEFAEQAAQGTATIYNCMNPSRYDRWQTDLPPLFRSALESAKRAQARLVVLDNFYMVGQPGTAPFDESTPMNPCSKKGELRAKLATELLEARQAGDVVATSGRASDYYGPTTPFAAIFSPRFFDRLRRGKAVEVLGDPDQPHSYSFTPDVARGLAVLGAHEHATQAPVWHLPIASQQSTRSLIDHMAERIGVVPRLRSVSATTLKLLGLFAPQVGAAAEMVYQWRHPFIADDGKFRRTFGIGPTALDESIEATLVGQGTSPSLAA